MNRRNCLKLLAGLLPCAFVARILGEKDLAEPQTEILYHKDILSKLVPNFTPVSGFHVEIRELPERWTEWEGKMEKDLPCFQADIRDCKTNHMCRLRSPVWEENDPDKTKRRRFALDALYWNIGEVIRRRQFPKDTLIYDQEITVNGVRLMNPRYPK